jgi:hypothetical protein
MLPQRMATVAKATATVSVAILSLLQRVSHTTLDATVLLVVLVLALALAQLQSLVYPYQYRS